MIPTDTYQYLKEHIGCMFSLAEHQKHKRKWRNGETLQLKDLVDRRINCCQQLPNEIILESDYKGGEQSKNKENQDYAESILQKSGVGYFITSHKGKSDYLWFRFKTKQEITPGLRLAIIRYMAKPGLQFDEGFFSLKYVRAVPGRYHWKHSYNVEQILKVVPGEDLDIDVLGIKEPFKPEKIKVASGSMPGISFSHEPKGWACSISITRMAKKYNLENCPACSNPLTFTEKVGRYSCDNCKLVTGGLKQFAGLILQSKAKEQTA